MDPATLDQLTREDLIVKAQSLGTERPELMTRVELRDEIVRRTESDPAARKKARGWLGVARDLVAGVVESGLNLRDAAALIRGEPAEALGHGAQPVASVTLAEIYLSQGHLERAKSMLDEILAGEPEHEPARRLRERIEHEGASSRRGRRGAGALLVETEASAASSEPVSETISVAGRAVTDGDRGPCVLLLRSASRPLVACWDLGDLPPAADQAPFVLKAVSLRLDGTGVQEKAQELPIEERRGRARLEALPEPCLVRLALGIQSDQRFLPLALGSELRIEGEARRVTFRPPVGPTEPEPTPRERALADDFSP